MPWADACLKYQRTPSMLMTERCGMGTRIYALKNAWFKCETKNYEAMHPFLAIVNKIVYQTSPEITWSEVHTAIRDVCATQIEKCDIILLSQNVKFSIVRCDANVRFCDFILNIYFELI